MTIPLDAQPIGFVDHAPSAWRPYLRLSRFDRPIGFWLLALPCFMGQFFGRAGIGFSTFDLVLMLAWIVGSIAMRGAGCSFNDLVDRDIDGRVERTRGRPLPAGLVTPRQAFIWTLAQCGVGLGVLLMLPTPAQLMALCAIPLVGAYPFMKRITWWPQVWLGLTFNWGVLVGYVAVMGSLDIAALCLYAACVCWTIGYDTIYAQQDVQDDALVGVKSTARLFGDQTKIWVVGFYSACTLLVLLACSLKAQSLIAWMVGLGAGLAFGAHLFGQARALPAQGVAQNPLKLFKSNQAAGLILVVGLGMQALVGWIIFP